MSKQIRFILRMSEQERQQLRDVAAMYGMSESETVREAIRFLAEFQPRLVQPAIVPDKLARS